MLASSSIPGWRLYNKRYLLEGFRCPECQRVYFPDIFLCACGCRVFKPFKLSGIGKLISFTNITSPSAEFKHFSGYCIGLVELEEGPRVTVQLADVDLSHLYIGMSVRAVFRKFYSHGDRGIVEYGLKFEPTESGD